MTITALLRVSVVAGGRRLDLAVPPALPVSELVPGLARRLGVVSYDALRLCTITGSVLDDCAGLASQGVPDGAVLVLAPPPPPPTLHDDPAEALAGHEPPGDPPRWWPLPAAALLLLLGTVALALADEARIAGVVALVLLAVGLGVGRAAPTSALVAAFAASGYAALAAAHLAADVRPGPGMTWAAPGGAVLAVTSLGMVGLPTHRLRLLPALVAGVLAAAVGAVLCVRDVPVEVLASVLLAVVAAATAGLPWVVVGRITRPRGRVDVDALAEEAHTARELLLGSSAALAGVHVALAPLVAWQGMAGMALVACASAIVLLRARHLSILDALPGLVAGAFGLLVVVGVGLWQHEPWRPAGAIVLAGAGVIVLAQARVPRPPMGGRDAQGSTLLVRPLLRAAETACLVALLPLLVLATGALETLP